MASAFSRARFSDGFALHFLLQRPEGLIDIVIANDDLHAPEISDWPWVLGMERGPNKTPTGNSAKVPHPALV